MKKKLAALLIASMAVSLSACGNSAGNSTATNSNATQAGDSAETADDTAQVGDALAESGADLQTDATIDNSVKVDSVTVIDKTSASLSIWGTNNDVPGNYEVYEMLYECDAKGNIYPLLADANYDGSLMPGCDHEEGSSTYEIHIYDYIKDHNGNEVTASDVAFSFMYQYENESTSGWGDLISVEAVNDTTVLFTFTEEQKGLGELENIICRCFIVDEDSYNASSSKLANEMCGTGPYKFDSYVSGESITIVANDDYWQTDDSLRRQESQVNARKISYLMIDEAAQKVVALETGAAQLVTDVKYEDALEFEDGGAYADDYNVFTYLQKFVYYINPNCSEESVCSDENLRMAIFNAIDQDGLIAALGGTLVKLPSYASSYYSDYDYVDWNSYTNYNTKTSVDAKTVQDYLDKSSYNGETLRMICVGTADTGTVVAAQLAAFGINCEVQSLDFSTGNATLADPGAWELTIGMMAGDYNATVWQHGFSYSNTATGDCTANFVKDDEWNALLDSICTADGHTKENMATWWENATEHAYTMALYTGNSYNVVPANMKYVCQGDKLVFLPGGCCYTE